MRHPLPSRSASPASGWLRAVRAAGLAALCVLLPLAGHVLLQGHAPRWSVVAVIAAVTALGAVGLTRRRLSDAHSLSALAGAQVAYHAAYSLPGACGIRLGRGAPADGLSGAVEHVATAGPPPWAMVAGHLVTVMIVARLLGVTEALLWRSESLVAAVWQLLLFVWPLGPAGERREPGGRHRDNVAGPHPALVIRLNSGRAPPASRRARVPSSTLSLPGPITIGGPCLP
ncbi:hypothetical protein ACFU76_01640 [Streptomyces sp. NPDC057539]|uniref:hypothetical protein n=1 Tax=Streptomyces sp. NPDC057539 TaxID=3346159 RepID=UPI00369B8C3A